MELSDFQRSLDGVDPPELPPALRGLWLDGKGDWDAAHRLVQSFDDRDCAWVHAYLHRKEGDLGNARYWYRRAGRDEHKGELAEEWREIARALLSRASGDS